MTEKSKPFETPLTTTEQIDFQQKIPFWVIQAANILMEHGKAVYLVGGAVRDLLWGEIPSDWDLATDALPEEVEGIFPKTLPTGKRFGTITVEAAGHQLQITTLREDLGYSDGRRPDQVSFGSDIVSDLARRDFTINAVAYDFNRRLLIDPFGGRKDCRRRIIRSVGDPALRFREDGLRIFRFYRLLAAHDLKPERKTEKAIDPELAKFISYERIRDEFSKLLLGKAVRKGLNGLVKSGLMTKIIPEFSPPDRTQSELYSYLREHSFAAVAAIRPSLHLRLAALLHDIAKPVSMTVTDNGVHFYGHDQKGAELSGEILKRLRYPGRLIAKVSLLIRWHMFFYQSNISDAAVRRLIAKVGGENIPDLLELRRADIIATGRITPETMEYWKELSERISAFLQPGAEMKKAYQLAVNGHDLIKRLGLNPGPLIGEIIAYLSEQILEKPELNREELLLNLAQKYLESKLR